MSFSDKHHSCFLYKLIFGTSVLCTILLFNGCNNNTINSDTTQSKILDSIESQMFQNPENLDSLIEKVDTTHISMLERGRISMLKGYIYYKSREYDKSIKATGMAETIFLNLKDDYHQNINNLIKAFTFELLNLNDNAGKLYIETKNYFEANHLDRYQFYSLLGMLRFSSELNLDKILLVNELNTLADHFNEPIYPGLLNAALGFIEKDDSLKCDFYEKAKIDFIKAKRWERVYSIELNILYTKINQDPSAPMQRYYNEFPESAIAFTPSSYQKMRYDFAQAHLFGRQWKNDEALALTTRLLNKADSLNFPSIQADCTALLNVLYLRKGDYKNAYYSLLKDNSLREKENIALQNNRLLVLGAYYRYATLENDKLNLKIKNQRSLLLFTIIGLILVIVLWFVWSQWKKSKHKNIQIVDQLNNLIFSLENEKNNNTHLISQLEDLKDQYHIQEISQFIKAIENKKITRWIDFEAYFIKLKPNWIENIKAQVPDLTPVHIKYCMCLYFNLNNQAIADLCCVSVETIKSAKKRLRDKFSLEDSTEIYVFLKKFD